VCTWSNVDMPRGVEAERLFSGSHRFHPLFNYCWKPCNAIGVGNFNC
jgi:hypothetical protein